MQDGGEWELAGGKKGSKGKRPGESAVGLSKREAWDDGPERRREEGSTWPGSLGKM